MKLRSFRILPLCFGLLACLGLNPAFGAIIYGTNDFEGTVTTATSYTGTADDGKFIGTAFKQLDGAGPNNRFNLGSTATSNNTTYLTIPIHTFDVSKDYTVSFLAKTTTSYGANTNNDPHGQVAFGYRNDTSPFTWNLSTAVTASNNVYISAADATAGNWVPFSYTILGSQLAASNGQDITLRFIKWSLHGGRQPAGTSLFIDNLTVTAIPEPGTACLLMGSAALAFAGHRRRRI